MKYDIQHVLHQYKLIVMFFGFYLPWDKINRYAFVTQVTFDIGRRSSSVKNFYILITWQIIIMFSLKHL